METSPFAKLRQSRQEVSRGRSKRKTQGTTALQAAEQSRDLQTVLCLWCEEAGQRGESQSQGWQGEERLTMALRWLW